jgi:CDP-paratose 2-epimerase
VKYLVTGGRASSAARSTAVDGTRTTWWSSTTSRRGADSNLAWLKARGLHLRARRHTRHRGARRRPPATATQVIAHLAAQVAVTMSVTEPRHDFEVNALGTFNLLESARRHTPSAAFLYASTNKVYGGLEHVGVEQRHGRYAFRDRPGGISEAEPLDFHSPYGCSKGAADQYVRDYARIYGLRSVVFRQSCIYGYRQFGVEDQGWVAWFTIQTVLGRPITIYGDGKQVRDMLFIDDLLDAYDAAVERIDRASGQVFNLGGGPENTLSLLELVQQLDRLTGRPLRPAFADWRPGDQPVFIADVSGAAEALGWRPRTGVAEGVQKLAAWVQENRALFE